MKNILVIFTFYTLNIFAQSDNVITDKIVEKIVIKVKVPNQCDEVYISGNQDALGNWRANVVKMDIVSNLERMITLNLSLPVEFKFTKGDWDKEGIIKNALNNDNLTINRAGNGEYSYEVTKWYNNGIPQDLFNWVEIIMIIGAVQSFFLAISITRISRQQEDSDKILSLLLFLATFMLIGRIVFLQNPPDWIIRLGLILDTVVFLFGPLLYIYIKILLFKIQLNRRYLLHFIPATLHLLTFLTTLHYTHAEYRTLFDGAGISLCLAIIVGISILLNLTYLYLSFQLLQKYKKQEAKYLSFKERFDFVKVLLGFFFVILISWGYSYYIFYFKGHFPSWFHYNFIWIIIPIATYFITYYVIRMPEIFKLTEINNHQNEHSNNMLNPIMSLLEKSNLRSNLNLIMEQEKPYLNDRLTLNELATMLKSTSNKVSWLLNNELNISFYDFINKYRIEAFIQLTEKQEHKKHTLLALAYQSGFNSKTTFNKHFKHFMNCTPSFYLKKMEEENENSI